MTLGPVDFLAVEFPGNQFRGEILPSLFELVEAEVIRIIDLVIISKDPEGKVTVRELQELDPDAIRVFDPLKVEVRSMITRADIDMIAYQMEDDSTAGIMLFENVWAQKTKQAMLNANGRLLMFDRIPHEIVEEAVEEIAAMSASAA